ncbi:MAG: hydroxymethylbilane synthase [Candidatus Omnitrophica bacterium]|nr:hydroxymethylbilane synthase [Candidatus Omnitrophota bacterium]
MRTIVFGIRKSALARRQLEEFIAYLAKNSVTIPHTVKAIQTQGDKDKTSPMDQMGQGIFTKEIERAILSHEIDCAVHSLKDMPVKATAGTVLSFCGPREDVRDCLVLRDGVSGNDLKGLRIGTGSPRREAFLKEIAPSVKLLPIRGNVDTRLRKLDQGDYEGIVLAACGLKRLGYGNRISRYFDPQTFVPAAGQGVICSQTRADDAEINSVLEKCASLDTAQAVAAERKVLEALEVGCHTPFGVYARFDKEQFIISARLYVEHNNRYIAEQRTSSRMDREKVTADLIDGLKKQAGKQK